MNIGCTCYDCPLDLKKEAALILLYINQNQMHFSKLLQIRQSWKSHLFLLLGWSCGLVQYPPATFPRQLWDLDWMSTMSLFHSLSEKCSLIPKKREYSFPPFCFSGAPRSMRNLGSLKWVMGLRLAGKGEELSVLCSIGWRLRLRLLQGYLQLCATRKIFCVGCLEFEIKI